MKLKTILILTLLFVISIAECEEKKRHRSNLKTDNKQVFTRGVPINGHGKPFRVRSYRTVGEVFPGRVGRTFSVGQQTQLSKRSCDLLCKDRVDEDCPRGLTAVEGELGIVECKCKKSKSKKVYFPQADYCFQLSGCYPKPIHLNCW